MNLKKFIALCCSVVLALASLFSLGLGGEVSAVGVTLYWCNSSNSNFNNSANWSTADGSCTNSGNLVPGTGDNLIFDDTLITNSSGIDPTNDISNLDVNSISFIGSDSFGGGYNIVQQSSASDLAITVDAGITDTGTGSVTNQITAGINLNGNQNITTSGSDDLQFSSNLNLGSNNATLSSGSDSIVLAGLQGTGSLNFSSPSSGVAEYTVSSSNSSSFSGPVNISPNANVTDNSGTLDGLGSGTITVSSGGSLKLTSTSTSGTLANDLVLAGSGDGSSNYGAIISCLGPSGCSTSTLNLSGDVTLTGNTSVVNGSYSPGNTPSFVSTFSFSGNITYNGFTLTGAPNSSTVVNFGGGSDAASATDAPGNPDTGEALVASHVRQIIIGAVLVALGLVILGIFGKRSKSGFHKK